MADVAEKRAGFRRLHDEGCFVLPNPWDAGGAQVLQHLGFAAIASTSAGYAWSWGRADNRVELDDLLAHLAELSAAVDIPLNADFENGFAREPEAVAANVRRAAQAGVSGLSVEDLTSEAAPALYEPALATARIRAARDALAAENVILVARTEGLLHGLLDLNQAIDRAVMFAEAGADCIYVPGVRTREEISTLVRAVAPKPVNVLMAWPGMSVAELADLGVRRVSTGGALARRAWAAFVEAAEEIKGQGTFGAFGLPGPSISLNKLFAG
ncbi:isocitrate lyase/phosphoenolpyruvate mutase family protein [Phenylobacterium sp.]|jgi:2-methylisocitrate lyase-like PEP mutase family enzyme|uniref:isocitrate lyase/PEP mutase family protein n=1 Tax=Phenylobacterium sp. TaxID=1871053 RepID=UPI002E34F95F|nr:isocitrate lyase/phosphoenolpyruvate mutase family protein [Phenylobacterium sp.]HEX2562076.1 isocitrate lyase/phosphoenolpyruvate mutase family protein [Phenylobacterium sp.]